MDPEETEEGAEENGTSPQTQATEMNGRRSMRAGPSNGGRRVSGPSAPPLSVVVFDNPNCLPASCSNTGAAVVVSAPGTHRDCIIVTHQGYCNEHSRKMHFEISESNPGKVFKQLAVKMHQKAHHC